MVQPGMGLPELLAGKLRNMGRVAAGDKTVAGVGEKAAENLIEAQGVRGGERALHLVEHHALVAGPAFLVQLIMPALLAEDFRLLVDQRVQHRVHIDPHEIVKILPVAAGNRIEGLVPEGESVEKGIHGALQQLHKRFLDRIMIRAAEHGMFQDVKNAGIVPGLGLKGDAKGLVFLRTLQPDQPRAGCLVLHLMQHSLQLLHRPGREKFEVVDD